MKDLKIYLINYDNNNNNTINNSKNEKQEDILLGYLKYLDNISRVIEVSDEKVKKIDIKGSFEGDDEVGHFFKTIKNIQEILNDFNIKKI